MADATNPQAGVAPTEASPEARVLAILNREEPDETQSAVNAPEASEPVLVEAKQSEDDLTPEDIPADDEPAAQPAQADAFEIVHQGTQHKLSREEVIKFAQQGFDYSQKMHKVGEEHRQAAAMLQRAQEAEQIQQALLPELAELQAIGQQLKGYEQVNWVQLATDNPLEYPKYRAQYDLLVQSFNTAAGRAKQKGEAVQQARMQASMQMLQRERELLNEMVPAWRDPDKYATEAKQLRGYLMEEGVPEDAVNSLSSAVLVKLFRKSMAYDRLLKSKGDKSKLLQTAPPVARPGIAQGPGQAQADKDKELKQRLRKSGSIEDAASLYLNRMR